MIDSKVFAELMNRGVITNVGLNPADYKDIDDLKRYGLATTIGSTKIYEDAVANNVDVKDVLAKFISDVAAGGTVVLPMDLTLDTPVLVSKDVIIDLNGYSLKSTQDVFEVKSGTLTINGDGLVYAGTDNTCSWCAVYAHGKSKVQINGGDYKVGAPVGDYNDLIYAKDSAIITINGGKFYVDGTVRVNDSVSFMLNLKDNTNAKIEVKGGSFEKTNPAAAKTEPGGDYNFVAEGYESVANGDWFVVTPIAE